MWLFLGGRRLIAIIETNVVLLEGRVLIKAPKVTYTPGLVFLDWLVLSGSWSTQVQVHLNEEEMQSSNKERVYSPFVSVNMYLMGLGESFRHKDICVKLWRWGCLPGDGPVRGEFS